MTLIVAAVGAIIIYDISGNATISIVWMAICYLTWIESSVRRAVKSLEKIAEKKG